MMSGLTILASGLGILADSSILESAGRALSAGPERTETLLFASVAGILILIILLLARVFGRESGEEVGQHPDYLTVVVDLLGLSESDRRDLQRIAKSSGLGQPASMLLSPMNLARAVTATPEIRNDKELRRRMERLCLSVFDAPLPDPGRPHRRSV